MSEIRHYIITQTREVEVTANNMIDAARLAAKAFEAGQSGLGHLRTKEGLDGVWGDTEGPIKATNLNIQRLA